MNKTSIEASPYIAIKNPNEKVRNELYTLPFEISLIANKFGPSHPVKYHGFWESNEAYLERLENWKKEEKNRLFDGWSCKDMYHFTEIYNEETHTIITFEPNEYEVNYSGRKFLFQILPDTIDDFINDLKRIGVPLFWKKEIADIYGIQNITSNQNIINYYSMIESLISQKTI